MPLQLDDLAALDEPGPAAAGQPLLLPVADIDEDPDQPRREFDADALQELSETIRERGVRQPISVRPNPSAPGRWLLNFGARRLRASRLAGREAIPAFIDATVDSYDQVIENEQREGLRPLELALFVQKRLTLGDRQADIARRLGKSRQWVTVATALIEAPDWLLQAYREDRCRGMNELYELRRLHGQHAAAVETWVARQCEPITRDQIAGLRAQLQSEPSPRQTVAAGRDSAAVVTSRAGAPRLTAARNGRTEQRIHVEYEGQEYQLDVSRAPGKRAHMYLRPLADGPSRVAPASALKLLGFADG